MFSTNILLFYLINITLKIISTDPKWQENFVRHMNKIGLKCSEPNLVSDTDMKQTVNKP